MKYEIDGSSHFAFGKNWRSFVSLVDEDRIQVAIQSIRKLFPDDELQGAKVIDIGCGSGLFLLAASRLGASHVRGIDIDGDSVAATRALMDIHANSDNWSASETSLFALPQSHDGQYDIVYSWGVLHHTGDMWGAIASAMRLVRPGGYLAIALYHKSLSCGFWKAEKKFYSAANASTQRTIMAIYKFLYRLGLRATGRNPGEYERNYRSNRGMDWTHDAHDWLGGYPYESARAQDVMDFLTARGFRIVRTFVQHRSINLFGAGCDEFVAIRKQ